MFIGEMTECDEAINKLISLLLDAGFVSEEIYFPQKDSADFIINPKEERSKNIAIKCIKVNENNLRSEKDLLSLVSKYRKYLNEYTAYIIYFNTNKFFDEILKKREENKNSRLYFINNQDLEFYKLTINTIGKELAKYHILKEWGLSVPFAQDPIKTKVVFLE